DLLVLILQALPETAIHIHLGAVAQFRNTDHLPSKPVIRFTTSGGQAVRLGYQPLRVPVQVGFCINGAAVAERLPELLSAAVLSVDRSQQALAAAAQPLLQQANCGAPQTPRMPFAGNQQQVDCGVTRTGIVEL